MFIEVPDDVLRILTVLRENNYKAYVVGGCVRDSLLGCTPHDWDITTDATPDEVSKLFKKVIPSGIDFGTVTVRINKNSYEVTTFRKDGRYSDGRHPDAIQFEKNLSEDVSRRDLTINAIAYNPWEGVIDLVGGLQDLADKKIRFVGNPYDRLREDPLRALRAIRFAARYNFGMDDYTANACLEVFADRCNCISSERIHDEIVKFFTGRVSKECINLDLLSLYVRCLSFASRWIGELFDVSQYNKYHIYDVFKHTLHVMHYTTQYNDYILSMAALLHDIGKKRTKTVGKDGYEHFINHARESVSISRNILAQLRFSKEETRSILFLVANHDIFMSGYKMYKVRKFLAGRTEEEINRLLILRRADSYGQNPTMVDYNYMEELEAVFHGILRDKTNITLHSLKINGDDILAIGVANVVNIRKILDECLNECYRVPKHNNRDYLLEYARRLIIRNEY